ncbi:hypothetical protein [Pedobacter nyackensis]|uniref:Uncharacterized protein n=1 Tax=Pedobacter nyackensis TaxID=475255 RepID=A0A1W2F357_9SPHI|nr:hypothetical protein [Pedobacter nyackensis]SMD16232.1 hypothetical protein SAMN04488101_11956 [Pedobacter nyackensis]
MKRVKSLVFNSLSFDDPEAFKDHLVAIITNFGFNEKLGYGLSLSDLSDNVLTVKVVKRTSTFINDFDSSENQFVRKQIYIFSDFVFSIDLNFNILYVIGGISHMNCVKYLFRTILSTEYELNPVNLNVSTFYKLLVGQNVSNKIDHITINHFNFNNELVGRFSGLVMNNTIGPELIESYKSDIVKLSFLIQINENESFTLQIFPNGVLKFLSETDDFDFILDYLKQLIFTKNG